MTGRAADPPRLLIDLSMAQLDDAATSAGENTQAPPAPPPYGITGDWGGLRNKLAEINLTVGGMAQLDISKVLRAGLDTEAFPVRSLVDLHVLYDTDGHQHSFFYFDLQYHDESENHDAAVGDIQGFDSLEAPRFVQVGQLWCRMPLSVGPLGGSLKIGKIDANAAVGEAPADVQTGFSLIEHGIDFLHSAAAYSPAIFPMVTYPDPAPGAEFFLGDATLYGGAGTFYSNGHQTFLNLAGHPETVERSNGGMFSIAEFGGRPQLFGSLATHYGIGGWYASGRFPRIDQPAVRETGAGGGYFYVDQGLYQEMANGAVVRDLGVFLDGGISDARTSPMSRSLTAGLAARGFIPGRKDDSFGLLATWAHLPPQAGLEHPFELATELFYKWQITPWASLKPSFGYIVNPSGKEPDAAEITIRAEVDF